MVGVIGLHPFQWKNRHLEIVELLLGAGCSETVPLPLQRHKKDQEKQEELREQDQRRRQQRRHKKDQRRQPCSRRSTRSSAEPSARNTT